MIISHKSMLCLLLLNDSRRCPINHTINVPLGLTLNIIIAWANNMCVTVHVLLSVNYLSSYFSRTVSDELGRMLLG